MTTRTEVAARILERCAEARTYWTSAAEACPQFARADRKRAAVQGWVSEYDDPTIRVRVSELEALCRGVLGQPDPTPHDETQPALFDQEPAA